MSIKECEAILGYEIHTDADGDVLRADQLFLLNADSKVAPKLQKIMKGFLVQQREHLDHVAMAALLPLEVRRNFKIVLASGLSADEESLLIDLVLDVCPEVDPISLVEPFITKINAL